jgi:hypothetical protein
MMRQLFSGQLLKTLHAVHPQAFITEAASGTESMHMLLSGLHDSSWDKDWPGIHRQAPDKGEEPGCLSGTALLELAAGGCPRGASEEMLEWEGCDGSVMSLPGSGGCSLPFLLAEGGSSLPKARRSDSPWSFLQPTGASSLYASLIRAVVDDGVGVSSVTASNPFTLP